MLDFPRWKVWGISLLCIIGVALAIPSFFPASQVAKWPGWIPSARIALGLDLAGGSYLLYEADPADLAKTRLENMRDTMSSGLRRLEKPVQVDNLSIAGGRLTFIVRDPTLVDAAHEYAREQTAPAALGQRDWSVNVIDQNRIEMVPTQSGLDSAVDSAMTTALEVVRNRVDPDGTRDATVIRQGGTRILVEVPGIDDPEALKDLIGKTAKLDFKLVDLDADPALVAQGRAPVGSQVLRYADNGGPIAVERSAIVTGERITDAKQEFGENGEPVVTITFDTRGGKAFGRVTQANVGKPFAIILDNTVISAPNINQPILGGAAQITGSFTIETANALAVQLRSGSLPVELQIVEERSVGGTLGRDSIEKGALASGAAVIAVMLFMLVTYGRFGIYANIALILNSLMILGIMALFKASLTLPGIAGFVLTIGAAVDANVLINERIREELKRGRGVRDAIEHGYTEASTAIFDANITNVIAAVIMYYFGSGPIKGFAVVLMIGIVTSVFTAVNVTRMFVALWLRKARPREIHI